MDVMSTIRRLFRRKPMTDQELRSQQAAKIAADHFRGLKSSQLSGAGQDDAAARGGRGDY